MKRVVEQIDDTKSSLEMRIWSFEFSGCEFLVETNERRVTHKVIRYAWRKSWEIGKCVCSMGRREDLRNKTKWQGSIHRHVMVWLYHTEAASQTVERKLISHEKQLWVIHVSCPQLPLGNKKNCWLGWCSESDWHFVYSAVCDERVVIHGIHRKRTPQTTIVTCHGVFIYFASCFCSRLDSTSSPSAVSNRIKMSNWTGLKSISRKFIYM